MVLGQRREHYGGAAVEAWTRGGALERLCMGTTVRQCGVANGGGLGTGALWLRRALAIWQRRRSWWIRANSAVAPME